MQNELVGGSRYAASESDVLAEIFGDEIVAIQMKTGRYYSLRGIGRAVWQDLVAGHSPDQISTALAGTKGAPADEAVTGFITRLVEETLVGPVEEPVVADGELASPRAVLAGEIFHDLEVYDDMADLLQADPIHEVDEETGWPAPRPVEQG